MRFSKVTRILVASVAATVITTSGASAVEISANAVADGAERVAPGVGTRSIVATTSLTLTGKKAVRRGSTVRLRGKLSSSAPECVAGQWIRIYRKSRVVGNGTTNATGNYKIKVRVTHRKNTYQARFNGSASGVHPNDVACFSSVSPTLKVRGR